YFYEARTTDPQRAHVALAYIRRLYAVEADAKEAELDDDARRTLRQERSVPILGELFVWLEGMRAQVLPKSPMGAAIGYALNHKAALLRYTEQGFLEIDNNASERGEKTIAIGRGYAQFPIILSSPPPAPGLCCSAATLLRIIRRALA